VHLCPLLWKRFRHPCLQLLSSLHQHAWLLDPQHMYTSWISCLANQRCRCWRGVPGRIPVGPHSWGVVTCSVCYWWQGWSCDCQTAPRSCWPCAYHVAIVLACRWRRDAILCCRLLWDRQNTASTFFLAKKLSLMSCVSRVNWSAVDLPCRKPACS